MPAPPNSQPNFLQLLVANQRATKSTLSLVSFASGHAIQEALALNVESWPVYAVVAVVLILGAVAAWAILDDDQAMKDFGVKLALTGLLALGLGFLGFLLGSGWWFFMFVAVSTIVIVLDVKKAKQGQKIAPSAPADGAGG